MGDLSPLLRPWPAGLGFNTVDQSGDDSVDGGPAVCPTKQLCHLRHSSLSPHTGFLRTILLSSANLSFVPLLIPCVELHLTYITYLLFRVVVQT